MKNSDEVLALAEALLRWLNSQDAPMDIALMAMGTIIASAIADVADNRKDASEGVNAYSIGLINNVRFLMDKREKVR